jgi:hypothetical protein
LIAGIAEYANIFGNICSAEIILRPCDDVVMKVQSGKMISSSFVQLRKCCCLVLFGIGIYTKGNREVTINRAATLVEPVELLLVALSSHSETSNYCWRNQQLASNAKEEVETVNAIIIFMRISYLFTLSTPP